MRVPKDPTIQSWHERVPKCWWKNVVHIKLVTEASHYFSSCKNTKNVILGTYWLHIWIWVCHNCSPVEVIIKEVGIEQSLHSSRNPSCGEKNIVWKELINREIVLTSSYGSVLWESWHHSHTYPVNIVRLRDVAVYPI